jgi:hypothetical protein
VCVIGHPGACRRIQEVTADVAVVDFPNIQSQADVVLRAPGIGVFGDDAFHREVRDSVVDFLNRSLEKINALLKGAVPRSQIECLTGLLVAGRPHQIPSRVGFRAKFLVRG